jgi:methoxymalonate biosynthesis protein
MSGPVPVKCVVWDIDNTLLTGVYLEAGDRPPAVDPVLAAVLAELGGRGILHALASKNPPAAAEHTAAVTGWQFAAAECGWGRKPDALTRIASTLGIGVDTLAFVDDDPVERAEVTSALPQVLVLTPAEAAEAAGWPEFSPPVVTAEARRRGQLYAERRQRQAAQRSFGGTRDEFLRSVGTDVSIARAGQADLPRLNELAVRTRQFNSAAGQRPSGATAVAGQVRTGREAAAPGRAWPGDSQATAGAVPPDWFAGLLADPDTDVLTVRLRDSFGDDGLVGGCVIARRDPAAWTVRLLMISCRAMGRGVADGLLAWLTRQAASHGAQALRVPCTIDERNLPLRLALAGAGFRVTSPAPGGPVPAGPASAPAPGAPAGGPVPAGPASSPVPGGPTASPAIGVFERDLACPLPGLASWVHPDPEAPLAGPGPEAA